LLHWPETGQVPAEASSSASSPPVERTQISQVIDLGLSRLEVEYQDQGKLEELDPVAHRGSNMREFEDELVSTESEPVQNVSCAS
jgi:hypothetical protein